jgi:hypothetical protein
MGGRAAPRKKSDDEYDQIVQDVIELRSESNMTIKEISQRVGIGAAEVGKILQKFDVSRNRITLLGGVKQVAPYVCTGCGKKVKYAPCQVCIAENPPPSPFRNRSFD